MEKTVESEKHLFFLFNKIEFLVSVYFYHYILAYENSEKNLMYFYLNKFIKILSMCIPMYWEKKGKF